MKLKITSYKLQATSYPVLFIGRFQPFHLGHLDAIKQILRRHKKVTIGIGSSQFFSEPKNPFSAELRKKMIEKSLIEAGVSKNKFSIFKIPDINNDNLWVSHVEKIVPRFDIIYSGSRHVQKLFRRHGKYKIKLPKFNLKISATMVRGKMKRKQNWQKLVPKAVSRLINL
ncbi:nicotinamide-nucleotide adenylyltransferase [Candidatus Peregrinibacteria bacterium]|nr:nicotinamide-nucleotide adenylyltransferase [Candidatus Peregrinibacteria bacterium]